MQKRTYTSLWEGVAGPSNSYGKDTEVRADQFGVYIHQKTPQDVGNQWDCIGLGRDEAIDIAFAILRDCAPALAEALGGLRGPAAAGADATTPTNFRQYGDSNFI